MASTAVSTGEHWNPDQYARFRDERSRPFYDLASLVERDPGMRVIDLGCGTGELTAWLHRELGAAETLGVDSSGSMLERAAEHAGDGLHFEAVDITALEPGRFGTFDLVFSNAALQWIEGHDTLFPRLLRLVRPGGQLAVQMPANRTHPSHRLPAEIVREEPFRSALGGWVREDPVQEPEWYAVLLNREGAVSHRVRLEVYGHPMESTQGMVEWVKGTLFTAYEQRLTPEQYRQLVATYTERLLDEVGEQLPYFYTFRRVLMQARMPGA